MMELQRANSDVTTGGAWKPADCVARHRVAIIVPYRDRYKHLVRFLSRMIFLLKQQQVHFKIYVVEQETISLSEFTCCPNLPDLTPNSQIGAEKFNRGKLFNIGYLEALLEDDWQCFVFHDVDLLPEDIRNKYTCPTQPRHMSVAVDTMDYVLFYEELVGGALNLRTGDFRRINGFSNKYWGWGAEDDDMFFRYILLNSNKYRNSEDGLNSVEYKLVSKTMMPLYTILKVDLGHPSDTWYMTGYKSCDGTLNLLRCLFRITLY